MDACISQLIWLMPLIDSDVHDLQTIRHDWHECKNSTIDVTDAQLLIMTFTLCEWYSMTNTDAHILWSMWPMLLLCHWCGMIDMDVHILQSMWPMHNDQFWRLCFTIDVTNPWWWTLMHAHYNQCGIKYNIRTQYYTL
jgi:hypothetical protein